MKFLFVKSGFEFSISNSTKLESQVTIKQNTFQNGDKPPKLPPRDNAIYGPTSWWSKSPFDPYSQLPGLGRTSTTKNFRGVSEVFEKTEL